jgi:hypothetical protein
MIDVLVSLLTSPPPPFSENERMRQKINIPHTAI